MLNHRPTVLVALCALLFAAPAAASGGLPPLQDALLGAKQDTSKKAKKKATTKAGAKAKKKAKAEDGDEEGWHFERLGVGFGGLSETSRMSGEQWIHTSRLDESFNYERTGLILHVWGMGQILPNLWIGPEVRVMGRYTSDNFDFGLLQEVGGRIEWGLNFFEKIEFVLGGKVLGAVLIPGGDFSAEIERLQREGAGVWSIPRVGWTLGISAGFRRQMAERFWLRLDIAPQIGRVYLFNSSNYVDQYRVRKYWTSEISRIDAGIALEFAL